MKIIDKIDQYLNEEKKYKGKKYETWQGQDGHWFWTVKADPVSLHGQKAANEKEAVSKAKERIDKLVAGSKWKASL